VNADESVGGLKVYHYVNLALLGCAPLAFVAPPPLTFPIDLFLAVAFPVHAHIGMNAVISDYAKKFFGKGAVMPARYGMLGVTGVTTLGLLKLTIAGPGLIGTIKSLWKKPEKK
jgi:succinate dehydrogenase (ubiquinone) membrane anchor subunit